MKKNLITICCLLPLFALAQDVNLVGKNYIANADLFVEQYNPTTKERVQHAEKIFAKNWIFYVVGIADDNHLIIKQWPLGSANKKENVTKVAVTTKAASDNKVYARGESNNLFFVLDLKQFNDKTSPYFAGSVDLAFGIMTIPIKMRSGNDKKGRSFEFEEKFNLGLSVGPRIHFKSRKERSLSILLNCGVSSVRMDSLNTKGHIKEANSTSALTFGWGTLYQEGNINVGIFMGWDKVAGVQGNNWVYQSKPWFGIALGVSLFNMNISGNGVGENK